VTQPHFTTDQLATMIQTLNDSFGVLNRRVVYLEESEGYRFRLEWMDLAVEILDEWLETADILTALAKRTDRLEAHAAASAHWQANAERAERYSHTPRPRNAEESPNTW